MKEHTVKTVKYIVQAVLVFACTLCVLCVLFLLSARIPREALKENILSSAYRMEEQGERYEMKEGKPWTRMDNYADAEWLNILYSLDPDRPWQTMLESPIYVDFGGDEDSLVHALILRTEQDLPANTVYDRYWHGTVMLLRPLLAFMDMEEIYRFMAAVFVLLFLLLCALLYRRKLLWLAAVLAALLLPCGMQYMPFCAEYWPCWLIALLFMIYILIRKPGMREGSFLMLAAGTAAAYMDFLTTETVTFGLPFLTLLLLWEQDRPETGTAEYLLCLIRSGALWAAGYAGALLAKWTGSSLLLGENRIDFALNKAVYWESGYTDTPGGAEAVLENLRMVFPFRGITGSLDLLLLCLGIATALFCFVFLFRRTDAPAVCPALLAAACIPLLRFLALPLHAEYHAFFTFRALYLTLAALAAYIAKMTDWQSAGRYLRKILPVLHGKHNRK